MSAPRGLVLQGSTNRLFVVDTGYNRVLAFDVSGVTNGEAAVSVLGQTTFTAGSSGLAQNRLSGPRGAALSVNLLFVGDTTNNRVMVFDIASITNGENAVNVLGQANFTTSTAATSVTGLRSPRGVDVDGTNRLFVADTTNNRVLVFDITTVTDGEAAVNVLGQANFTTSTAATSSTGLRAPEEVIAEASARLFVGDTSNHRIMVFDVASIINGEAAVNVLGQTTFTTGTAATTQGRLSSPVGVFLLSSLLYAADGGNHRLMVFDVASVTDGENAVNLAGQVDGSLSPVYTKGGVNDGPNAQGFALSGTMSDLAVDPIGHRLFASDPANNRVLVFNLDTNNVLVDRVPDAVLGQASFYSSTAAVTQTQFSSPRGLAFDQGSNRLFVADYTNNRVMVFDAAVITNGESAVNVLGQTLFTTATAATSQSGLRNPSGVTFEQGTNRLFVADSNNHRVMVYDVASITNGENAVNLAGQVDGSLSPVYTKSGLNDGPNAQGLNLSGAFADEVVDASGHRLFATDPTNHRVLVFNLNPDNQLVDHTPDAVLGQTDFTSYTSAVAQNRFNSPRGLAYDPVGNRLFVADYSNSRVLVFDVAAITNGENAIFVLGQLNFTTGSGATTQGRLKNPVGLTLDGIRGWLFVGDYSNNRVMVFDVNSITNGENAINVLGQATFTTSTAATTQTGLRGPSGVTFKEGAGRLFVADYTNHRVTVFDVAAITDGEAAINVLGQATFTTAAAATTQSGMRNPQGVVVDPGTNRLFVADSGNHRVTIYDVAAITNGENAINVLGQTAFGGGGAAVAQNRMSSPRSVALVVSPTMASASIVYDYDPLYRLTAADYNGGATYFHYTYDAVGNRLTETTEAGPQVIYDYDITNRLTSVGGATYTWDNNGNLLNDGVSTYRYDTANRLVQVQPAGSMVTYSYGYNGLGDRLSQAYADRSEPFTDWSTEYSLDLTAGLTQALAATTTTNGFPSTNTYLYGTGRIGEEQTFGWQYHLGDALGSVRQLADAGAAATLATSYEPFGDTLMSAGSAATVWQFAGEARDGTGLTFLRARYLSTWVGRFTSRDVWDGDPNQPMSYNLWQYVRNNPINLTDTSGRCVDKNNNGACDVSQVPGLEANLATYGVALTAESDIEWNSSDARAVLVGVVQVGWGFANSLADLNYSRLSTLAFRDVFQHVNFHWSSETGVGESGEYYCERSVGYGGVVCYENARGDITAQVVRHELGHVFNATIENRRTQGSIPSDTVSPYNALRDEGVFAPVFDPLVGMYNAVQIAGLEEGRCLIVSPLGYRPGTRENTAALVGEDFGNMFANWATGNFAADVYGWSRDLWMTYHMYYWLDRLLSLPGDPPTMPSDL
jgi:RHS repeat-associated protein